MDHLKICVGVLLFTLAEASIAGGPVMRVPQSVPVFDTWGLVGISALLGILGILSLKRRK